MKTKQMGTDYLRRLTDLYVLLMLTLFPLYTGMRGYEGITDAKFRCFTILTVGYFAGLVLLSAELLFLGKLRLPGVKAVWSGSTLSQKLIVLFALICVISALCSDQRDVTWLGTGRYEGLLTTLLYVGIFLAVSTFGTPKKWQLYVLAGTVSAICVIALLQYAGYNPLRLFPAGVGYHDATKLYTGAFMGTIGNTDLLSAFFCITVPLFVVGAVVLRRWYLALPGLLCAAVLALSGVEAGVVGLGVGAILLAPIVGLYLLRRRRNPISGQNELRYKWGCGAALLILLAGGLVLLYWYRGPETGFLYEASQILHGNVQDKFGSSRIEIWRNVLALTPQHPLLGGGPGTLAPRLQMAFERELDSGVVLKAVVDTAHNEYLDLLANVGAAGLGLYLAALLATARRWLTAASRSGAALMLAAAVLCYAIQGFFSFSLCITAPFFWLTWGLLESTLRKSKSVQKERAE